MDELTKLITKALAKEEDLETYRTANDAMRHLAQITAISYNNFRNVGFSHAEAYEMASNIMLMNVEKGIT